MPDEALEERLAAVERALGDAGEPPEVDGCDADCADRLDALEDDVVELEAAVQALRGYVGSVRSVNEEVERRADAAMAKAETVERALATRDQGVEFPGEAEPAGDEDPVPDGRGHGTDHDHGTDPNHDHDPIQGRIHGHDHDRATGSEHPAGRAAGDPRDPRDARCPNCGSRSGDPPDTSSAGGGAGATPVGHRRLPLSDGDDPDSDPGADDGRTGVGGLLAPLREVL